MLALPEKEVIHKRLLSLGEKEIRLAEEEIATLREVVESRLARDPERACRQVLCFVRDKLVEYGLSND